LKPAALDAGGAEPFVFTAGSIRPYRGIEDIIAALAAPILKDTRCRLVVAGEVSKGASSYKERLERLAAQHAVGARITWAGELTPAEMTWCFEQCAAFVMTSRVEACPNIALEALSHGCLVISTRQPPMPEFFSDAALYYAMASAPELAAHVRTVLSAPPPQRQAWRAAALLQAGRFTWAETARRTVEQLQLALPQAG
jgi:glycosyltransferase involved in cell wall biosynthesis